MTLLWFVVSASTIVALVAWRQARRSAKRLAQLSEMYWELKYQQGELRVRVERLNGEMPPKQESPPEQPPGGFIPLSSLKR
ncbi:MAG: hypothetical protein O2930_06170 [Acidobacteria bacterium]|nr:hypothetical protein [Acidobacteriota bacterium]